MAEDLDQRGLAARRVLDRAWSPLDDEWSSQLELQPARFGYRWFLRPVLNGRPSPVLASYHWSGTMRGVLRRAGRQRRGQFRRRQRRDNVVIVPLPES